MGQTDTKQQAKPDEKLVENPNVPASTLNMPPDAQLQGHRPITDRGDGVLLYHKFNCPTDHKERIEDDYIRKAHVKDPVALIRRCLHCGEQVPVWKKEGA